MKEIWTNFVFKMQNPDKLVELIVSPGCVERQEEEAYVFKNKEVVLLCNGATAPTL